MEKQPISYSVSADGKILNCPSRIVLGSQNGKAVFFGTVYWGGRSLSDILAESGMALPYATANGKNLPHGAKGHAAGKEELPQGAGSLSADQAQFPEETTSLVSSLLPDDFPQELAVSFQSGCFMLAVESSNTYFRLARVSGNMALLFSFVSTGNQQRPAKAGFAGMVTGMLDEAARFFGIQEFIFYAQTGGGEPLQAVLGDKVQGKEVPSQIKAGTMFLWAQASFLGDSLFCRGVRELFGIRSAKLYLGANKGAVTCMVSLPKIQTGFVESSSLYLLVSFGKSMQFLLKGTFVFPYLKGMEFTVGCGLAEDAFRLEAFAHVERPVALFGPCSIGDTCLMVQMGKGLEFGLYSSLYIRNIQIFGAVMLKAVGNAVEPLLLSAAISDISIPILVDNLLGEHIAGIEALDFIKILGLPFQQMPPFPMELLEKKDLPAIVSQFNGAAASEALQLAESQVQLTPFGEGYDLADLKRMRHYYIGKKGDLQLAAQFYIALENTSLGNYTVERGYFICGVIEIFKKRFETLFSFRESEGILAYAKIPAMDLGFLQVGASKFQKSSGTSMPIAKGSLLAQFINPSQEGIVFFLSAGKKEVSFYLDGSVEILRLFRLDARVIYMGRKISVDLCTKLYGIFGISLHLLVDYGSFSSGNFEFSFLLDTSGLTEKLAAVTQKIDGAIHKLRDKIDNAKKEVIRAQDHVNELYGQIAYFDRKIAECKEAISHASWWKKAFVAIAKGLEIGAYEVAKIGIYTAIGVATAALEVAKGVLALSGKVGESVLQAVNAVIQGAMSLFYVNYIKLETKANVKEQYFRAEIDFVALGKKYHFSKQIGKSSMQQDSAGALSGAINSQIDADISHIEDGSFRSSWRQCQYQQYTAAKSSRRLGLAKEHVRSSVQLMKSMQDIYVEGLQVPLEECAEMNVSLIKALSQVEHVLETGMAAGNVAAFGQAMEGLKMSVAAQEKQGVRGSEELQDTKALIEKYDEARGLYNEVQNSLEFIRQQQEVMEKHNEVIYQKADMKEAFRQEDVSGKMGSVLLQVEEQMYEVFPVSRSGEDLINLSREGALREYFMEAEERLGIAAGEHVRNMRGRSWEGEYQNRL